MLFCQAKADLCHKPCHPHAGIDAINDNIKPLVETIMDKGIMKRGAYEKASIAKWVGKYGVLCTVQCFAQTLPNRPLKEGDVQGWENRCNHEVPTLVDHASL